MRIPGANPWLHMNFPDGEKVEKINLGPAGVRVFVFDSKGRRL